MPTAVLSANPDGCITSTDFDYAAARAGATLAVDPFGTSEARAGQYGSGSAVVVETFLSFDTTGITAVESIVLSVYVAADASITDFTLEARRRPWSSGGLTTGDWVPGASLSGLLLCASLSTAGVTPSFYNDLTSQPGFTAAINSAGSTELVLVSSRTTAGTDNAGGNEYLGIGTNELGAAATLTIVYALPKLQQIVSPMRW